MSMKKLYLIVYLWFAFALVAQAGFVTTNGSVTLAWSYPFTNQVDAFCVYATTNVALPATNWTKVLTLLNTNPPPNYVTQAVYLMIPAQMFFATTASNGWGESPFSGTAATPAPAMPPTSLTISTFSSH